jgi:hypothetical protein
MALGIYCCPSFLFISLAHLESLYCEEYVCFYTHTHTHTHIYLTAIRLYVKYHCYQITLQVKYCYTNQERCEGLAKYLSFRHQPGGDWANMWHWTEHFTIPAIKSWLEYPNENRWASSSQYNSCSIFTMTTEWLELALSVHIVYVVFWVGI